MDYKDINIIASSSTTNNIVDKIEDVITHDTNKLGEIGEMNNKADGKYTSVRADINTNNSVNKKNAYTGNCYSRATDQYTYLASVTFAYLAAANYTYNSNISGVYGLIIANISYSSKKKPKIY